MARYATELTVDIAPETAFAYLARFSSAEEWDPGVVEASMVSDEPVALGSRFLVVTEQAGRKLPLTYEIVEFDPPHRVALLAESSRIRSFDTITVTPATTTPSGAGCRVRYDADLQVRGPLRWIADPVLHVLFARIGDRAAKGLADALERLVPAS
jgi:carbon monoxide dehydrogenase subunit G